MGSEYRAATIQCTFDKELVQKCTFWYRAAIKVHIWNRAGTIQCTFGIELLQKCTFWYRAASTVYIWYRAGTIQCTFGKELLLFTAHLVQSWYSTVSISHPVAHITPLSHSLTAVAERRQCQNLMD